MISSTSSSLSHEVYLRKKRNKKLFRYGLIIFIIVALVALVSYVSHRPQIRISKVELSGGVLVTETDVDAKSREYLSGSYLWLFPKNNTFWYSEGGLADYLKESFKRIDTISIHRKDLKTLVVEIKERKPVAMWCEGNPGEVRPSLNAGSEVQPSGSEGVLSSAERTCYFLDQNSTIFAKAPNFSGDAYFKFYGSISGNNPIGTEYIASSTEFAELSDFIIKTKQLSLRPQYMIAKDGGEFSLVIAGGGQIMFDMRLPLATVAQNLEALLRTQVLATSTSGVLPVEYIDLRYGNKLFYKIK
ncbi:MAG TPA: hypothetical protein VJC13_03260 [Candidatus Paceibacterota bacterium]